MDEMFQREAEDDLKTIEYVRNYLPADLKEKFDDELIQYFLDVIWEYYFDTFSDTDEEVEIDTEVVAAHVAKVDKKEKMGDGLEVEMILIPKIYSLSYLVNWSTQNL